MKDLSELSNSNSRVNEQQCINEQIMDLKIWKDQPNNNKYSTAQYINKFESLKNKGNVDDNSDIDEFDNELDEINEKDHGIINKVSSINIKHPNFSSQNPTTSHNENNYRCMTEPDEYFFPRPSFPMLNTTPKKNGTIDTNYQNPYIQYSLMDSFTSPQINNMGFHANKGSFVSTQYSSNKIYHNYGSNEDNIFVEGEDSTNEKYIYHI